MNKMLVSNETVTLRLHFSNHINEILMKEISRVLKLIEWVAKRYKTVHIESFAVYFWSAMFNTEWIIILSINK